MTCPEFKQTCQQDFAESLYHSERILKRPKINYLLSSKTGLGHVSRAVAILNELENKYDITIRTNPNTHSFITNNYQHNKTTTLTDFDYKASLTKIGLLDETDFINHNRDWLESMGSQDIIITDFPVETLAIRNFFDQHKTPQETPKIVGIYHSCESEEFFGDDISKWQEQAMNVINATDISFLIDPTRQPPPHLTKEGTLIVNIGVVVRNLTKSPETVKIELGLSPEDHFIALAGGMKGKKEIDQILPIVSKIAGEAGKKVVYIQYDNTPYQGELPENTIVIRKIPDGHNILAAADFVIAKPGMQTLSECIAYNIPLVFISDEHPERQIKIKMLAKITDRTTEECAIDPNKDDVESKLKLQLQRNMSRDRNYYNYQYTNDAKTVASIIGNLFDEGKTTQKQTKPKPRPDRVTGKIKETFTLEESFSKSDKLKQEIQQSIITPLVDRNIIFSAFIFGGIAKGQLRKNSDADVLIVIEDKQTNEICEQLINILGFDILSKKRILSLIADEVDTLRLTTPASDGTQINISLMKNSSFNKIFTPATHHFHEESISSKKPYYVTNFRGRDIKLPKFVTVQKGSITIKERHSPATQFVDEVAILGIKQRMLLIQESLHDGLNLGNPTKKLMIGIVRALCYWNDLYEKNSEGDIIGVKRSSFFENYFFRMLRDPINMLSSTKYRQLRNLFFNELRRVDMIHRLGRWN